MEFVGVENLIKSGRNEYVLRTANDVLSNNICSTLVKDGMIKTVHEFSCSKEESTSRIKELVYTTHTERKEYIELLIGYSEDMPAVMDNAVWHDRLGMGFFNLGMFDEAQREFNVAIERNPRFWRGYNHLGRAKFNSGDCASAINFLEHAASKKPDYADFHQDLAEAYLKVGRCADSYNSADRAIIINASFGRAYYTRAMSLLMDAAYFDDFAQPPDFPERVAADLGRAISIDPSLADDEFDQAMRHLRQQLYKDAFEVLDKSPLMRGSQKFSQNKLSTYLKLAASFEDAAPDEVLEFVSYLEKKKDKNPHYADLHYELGAANSLLAKLFNLRATRHYRRALEVNLSYGEARNNLRMIENAERGSEQLLEAILGTKE